MDAANNPKKKTIAEVASEAFILILQLRSTNDFGSAEILRNQIIEMFDSMEKTARSSGIDNEKIRLSKFALVAFLDETIISSSWNEKDLWLAEPLQLKLFDSFNAGEEFFSYLNDLRRRSSSNKDVLEVYYLCLVLGFKGKYQLQSPENLRRIIDDLNMELHPEMYSTIDAISPNARQRETFVPVSKSSFPVWVYPAAALLFFFILYFVLSNSISDKAEEATEFLKNLIV